MAISSKATDRSALDMHGEEEEEFDWNETLTDDEDEDCGLPTTREYDSRVASVPILQESGPQAPAPISAPHLTDVDVSTPLSLSAGDSPLRDDPPGGSVPHSCKTTMGHWRFLSDLDEGRTLSAVRPSLQ